MSIFLDSQDIKGAIDVVSRLRRIVQHQLKTSPLDASKEVIAIKYVNYRKAEIEFLFRLKGEQTIQEDVLHLRNVLYAQGILKDENKFSEEILDAFLELEP